MAIKPFRLLLPVSVPILAIFLLMGLGHPTPQLLANPLAGDLDSPTGAFVVRIYYDRIEDLNRLSDYDLWEYNNIKENYVLASMDRLIFDDLVRQGWRAVVDEARTGLMQRNYQPNPFAGGYLTVDQHYAHLASVDSAAPELTELVDYGDSYCKTVGGCVTLGGETQQGYDLMAIRVTNESIGVSSTISGTTIVSGTKPIFFLMANIHAREITTPELARRLLDSLVAGYGVNADITWIVDWHEIWIVPIVNPDGHWLVELGERSPYSGSPFYQRKNADRSSGCGIWVPLSFSQYGVDLNRNHSFGWGGQGSSTLPCAQTFRGASPASEPEVAHLQTLVAGLIPDQRAAGLADAAPDDATGLFISLHSFGELVLWPWAHTTAPAPNRLALKAVGDKLASHNGYRSCQPTTCLYAASGTSDDWVYATLGIPAFTFEVGTEFMPAHHEVDSVQWPENGPALLYAARIARTPYLMAQGPDVTAITTTFSSPNTVTTTAEIRILLSGNLPISSSHYTIDAPPWTTGTVSYPLTAKDGSFDSSVEEATAILDLSGISLGRHMLFVRGQGSDGIWGPVYAAYIARTEWRDYYFPVWLHGGALIPPPLRRD